MTEIKYEDKKKVKPRIKNLMHLLRDRRGLVDRLNLKTHLNSFIDQAYRRGYITFSEAWRYSGQASEAYAR